MTKKIFILALCTLIPTLALAQGIIVEPSGIYTGPLQTKASPVVVELFSSENCPACPPADEYMQTLAKSNGVIALSCHVDYFGKTTANLGKKFCTQRQTRYIEQIGRNSHFTPQMMINGHMSEIGYETDSVAAAIVKGRSEKVNNITITPRADGVYDFKLPEENLNGTAEIWMAVYQKPKTVTGRGGSATYANVVKSYISLGPWQGTFVERAIYPILDSQSAGFTVIAQDVRSGHILAAGNFPL